MSKLTNTLNRRNFLKAAAYTSTLTIGAVSTAAFASCSNFSHNKTELNALTSSVTLFNQSDKTLALDATQPVILEKVNGWVVVKINKASEQSIMDLDTDAIITLTSGQQLAFQVDSELAPLLKESGDLIVITNEYSALNNMVPITTYDALVA